MTLIAMKSLPDYVSELKKSFILETIKLMWKSIINCGSFKQQCTPIVRHYVQDSTLECYYVLLTGKTLILSHCCNQNVLFFISRQKRTIQSMCINETCQKQRLEEKQLSQEHFDTIFRIQDRMKQKSITEEIPP